MLDHHIQRTIVYSLAFSNGMRFSELKPDDLENKAFDYHLKKVVAAGFVAKNEDGLYTLTSEGKRVGKGALKKQSRMIDRAYSILLLAIRRRDDGAWLLYRRQTHPLLGMIGFMQAQPVADIDICDTAKQECYTKTGLTANFSVQGHGYFRVYRNDELESFIHFTFLVCDDVIGDLTDSDEYYWDAAPDFANPAMLPTMETLHEIYKSPKDRFIEKTFRL